MIHKEVKKAAIGVERSRVSEEPQKTERVEEIRKNGPYVTEKEAVQEAEPVQEVAPVDVEPVPERIAEGPVSKLRSGVSMSEGPSAAAKLPPPIPKLLQPYEVSITSAKGSFNYRIETMHDVEILMQVLAPLNRPELPPAPKRPFDI